MPKKQKPKKATARSQKPSSGEAVIRKLDADAFKSYGMSKEESEKALLPDLAFHFGLVGHGFEMRVFEDGKHVGTACRDFSDSHDVAKLKALLFNEIGEAVKRWRKPL